MNIVKHRLGKDVPPTIIADLNGKIIHLNSKAITYLLPIKVGDNISRFLELDYIRKLSMFDNRIDVVKPKNCKFERVAVKVLGTGATKTIELCFMNNVGENAEQQLNDKRLLASYTEVIGKDVIGPIKLSYLINQIVVCMKEDLRFAYRKFEMKNLENIPELYANFSHLCTIAVGMIVALNEIEYKNTIKISVDKVLDEYVLNISVNTNTFKAAEGLHAFSELYPNIAMRLLYITSLCDNDEIPYKFSIKPNHISSSFVITEMINKTGKFSFSVFGSSETAFITYLMGLFLYDLPNGREGEEQE